MLEYHDSKLGRFVFLDNAIAMGNIAINSRISTDDLKYLMADLQIEHGWSDEELNERVAAIRKYSLAYRREKSQQSSIDKWKEALASDEAVIRSLVAINKQFPEITSKDKDSTVRLLTLQSIMNDSEELDLREHDWIHELVDDESESVRVLIANLGIDEHLDTLIHDNSERVRERIALNGFSERIATLITDPSAKVRRAIAYSMPKSMYHRLINDKDSVVRYLVARHGTDEDRDALMDDDIVIKAAIVCSGDDEQRKQLYATIPSLAADEQMLLKEAFAKANYNVAELACDKDPIVRLAVAKYSSPSSIEKTSLAYSENVMIRRILAERGVCLDILAHDPNVVIRCKVAEVGSVKHLELLLQDPMAAVRLEVIKREYKLLTFLEDSDITVKLAGIERISAIGTGC